MSVFAMAANSPLAVQPMVVGGMVDLLKLSERQAGVIVSVEVGGLALGILVLLRHFGRVNREALGLLTVLAIVTANLLTCFTRDFAWLLLLRLLSGLGAAAGFCIYCNMASSTSKPEHNFAIVNAVSIAYSGLLTFCSPVVLKRWGLPGIMVMLSLFAALALPLIPWVRGGGSRAVTRTKEGRLRIPRSIWLLLTMMLLLYTGHGAIWAYQERIGIAAGLSQGVVAATLGVSMLACGVIGSLFAGFPRWGPADFPSWGPP
jgi:predicted MFS family arabinose efflux permease